MTMKMERGVEMTDLEAIEKRVSRRTYLGEPIGEEDAAVFEEMIARFNEESGLQIQLVRDGSKAFEGFRRCYGMFSNVRSYFAMVGKYADLYLNEKIGYYGEKLVLEATKRGLGTCWVGGTFDRKAWLGAALCHHGGRGVGGLGPEGAGAL